VNADLLIGCVRQTNRANREIGIPWIRITACIFRRVENPRSLTNALVIPPTALQYSSGYMPAS
jgi:hypothetical protein